MNKKLFMIIFIILISSQVNAEWKPINRIPTTGYSGDFTLFKDKIWQIDILSRKIIIINQETGFIERSIDTPGFYPYSISTFRDTLIVSNYDDICFIDSEGSIYRTIDTPASGITGIASDGKYIWITERDGLIYRISGDDGIIIRKFSVPERRIYGLSYSDGYLWTSSRYRDEIYMINPEDGEVVNILPSPGPFPSGIFTDDKNLKISDFEKDSLYTLELPTEDFIIKSDFKKSRITLRWEIMNSGPGNIGEIELYIAIPENRPNQRILKNIEFSPEPDDIKIDKYEQKVAYFNIKDIKPEEYYLIKGIVDVELSSINYFIKPERVGKLKSIPGKIKELYLKDSEKYMINDPFIQKSLKIAAGDEKNPYWIARKVLDYIVDNIEYERIGGWDVAPEVLKRGKGSCSEYAYVFISLMRASGIPARYVGSITERGERASIDEVFHRWVEIYLPGYGWIPIDPGVADSKHTRRRALAIGHRPNGYLITTTGGGDSEYLEWGYNFHEKIRKYKQNTNFNYDRFGIWEPLD